MPTTYEPIATTTLGSSAATITFSSIPATYTDLRLIIKFTSSGTISHRLGFNGDTATNYSNTLLTGNGTAASSSKATSQNGIRWASAATGVDTTGNIPEMAQIDIFSYAGSTNKTVLVAGSGDANGSGYSEAYVGLWRSTAAITSLSLYFLDATVFYANTIATLYGIKNA